MAVQLGAPLYASVVTRLLVDLNRSVHHPRLFSELTASLPIEEKARILQHYYWPHRHRVELAIAGEYSGKGHRVVHVAVHSFAPRIGRSRRRADIGLLYDPSRRFEADLCAGWKQGLQSIAPDLRVRRNYPYRGVADGLPTALRRRFDPVAYAGIELELNQAWLTGTRANRRSVFQVLAGTLQSTLNALAQRAT